MAATSQRRGSQEESTTERDEDSRAPPSDEQLKTLVEQDNPLAPIAAELLRRRGE